MMTRAMKNRGAGDLPEDDERQRDADEGRDGIVGAGLRRAEIPLGVHIEVDAQAVGHKTQQQNLQEVAPTGAGLHR